MSLESICQANKNQNLHMAFALWIMICKLEKALFKSVFV